MSKERAPQKDLLVVKVGTNVLTDASTEPARLDKGSFASIGGEIATLTSDTTAVALVSSGAIAAGVSDDGRSRGSVTRLAEKQFYAATGWQTIIRHWEESVVDKEVMPALLTKHELDTTSTREQMLGVAAFCLLERGGVLLVNENDTIDPSEIKLGDNDTLAAELACAFAAKKGLYRSIKLILLTNADGLNEAADDNDTIIRTVHDIDRVKPLAGDAYNGYSRGGMKTKLAAAQRAKRQGVETFIANGREDQAISRALNGEIGTYFPLSKARTTSE